MHISLKKPLVYVARDIERALGMEPRGSYFVISNDSAYGREVQKRYPDNVWLVKGAKALDTYDLLMLPEVEKIISEHKADVMVFQNTLRIERLCAEKGWSLLNPSAELSKRVEEKISQVKWLDYDAKLLPPFALAEMKDVEFGGKRFVLQFNHSHTGLGTYIIDSSAKLEELKKKFPYRECRVTDFIDGPVFTINVVASRDIVIGNPSYQITGLSPFTDLPFSTVGNDWSLPQKAEYENLRIDTVSIAQAIGARMKRSGWKGLFGIDVVYDPKKKRTYLLEINARQPASATFESQLQGSPSVFEAHVAALIGGAFNATPRPVSGAQIVLRKTHSNISHNVIMSRLKEKGLTVIPYENTEHNKELLRIQSEAGIMEGHGRPNALGEYIKSCIN